MKNEALVKRMREWVEGLKHQSDNGQHMNIPSGLSAGTCWELANELEQFIQAALEAKDEPDYKALWQQMCERCDELDKKLAQQEAKDKPVAWMCADESLINKGYARFSHVCMGEWKIPVYTTPPQRTWDELTLAEVKEAYAQHAKHQIEDMGASGWVEFADALQTILRSKNT